MAGYMMSKTEAVMKGQMKEQRLRMLAAQWYEQELNRVAYEANGKEQEAVSTIKIQGEIEASYKAIEALE